MKCPFCECENTKVIDKRDNHDDGTTRRRRQCLRCSKRFTTYERIESIDVSILKKDGSLEKFDPEKISKSIRKAVSKERISDYEIDDFTDSIEKMVLNSEETISTNEIGLMILDWLKKKDQLAYIRFASVYKRFENLEDIKEEIKNLEKI